jgi:uncharacterized protein YjiS (DUF1127 family)
MRIKKRSIPQLLLRYLAEIIIIFLGITISFLFEQWREEKRQEKDLIELSESLLTDIRALKTKLKSDLGGSSAWISQLDSLRVQRIGEKISERQLVWFYRMVTGQVVFLFDPYSPTYISAVSSGIINELPDSIKNQLYTLYRVQLPFFQLLYDQQQENITNFRNNTLLPANTYLYRKEITGISPDEIVLAKEIQKPVYGNFINQVILTEKEVYKMNEEAFETLTELEGSLQEYIRNHAE